MSVESYQDDLTIPRPLSVQIPSSEPSSSIESSQTSSPTGILDSATSTSASCSSLPIHALNVKFAPLPQLAPRKRRSTAPLGMAARTQLVRRRRNLYDSDSIPRYGSNTSMWTEQELAEARMRQVAAAIHEEAQREKEDVADVDDPFLVFGRMVKGASKQIWRKMSNKEKKATIDTNEETQNQLDITTITDEEKGIDQQNDSKPSTPINGAHPLQPILQSSVIFGEPHEEGGVWEEEIGNDFPLNVSQTETIVEGRTKYTSLDAQVNNTPKAKPKCSEPLTPTPTSTFGSAPAPANP